MRSLPPVRALAQAKARQGLTISVCLPARDEEATVGTIVGAIRRDLMAREALVDEVLVIDDGSVDATARVAQHAGARVCSADSVLPALPAGSGKGNALWKSLFVSEGDILCFLDADVRNFEPRFVARLVEPLLLRPQVGMVKSFYRRPLFGAPDGGGRVTELMARPLLSHLFPELTRFVQPLSGEYAARREVIETVPFVQGWGVEIGLLVDVSARFGIDAVEQVDLGERVHRNRSLDELGVQAMAILVTGLRRAGLAPDHAAVVTELRRFGPELRPEHVPVEVRERPPMLTIPAYRAKFDRELSA
ncbi:MAG TPA: glucosyl-3-phosphoglycerate synthase [Acidimicrobiia bacterium]